MSWSILVVWFECRFLVTEVDGSNPVNSMLFPWARYFICIASVDSAEKWVPGGDNLVNDVQCYELFGGIALINNAFSFQWRMVKISTSIESGNTIAVLASFMTMPEVAVDNHRHDMLSKANIILVIIFLCLMLHDKQQNQWCMLFRKSLYW